MSHEEKIAVPEEEFTNSEITGAEMKAQVEYAAAELKKKLKRDPSQDEILAYMKEHGETLREMFEDNYRGVVEVVLEDEFDGDHNLENHHLSNYAISIFEKYEAETGAMRDFAKFELSEEGYREPSEEGIAGRMKENNGMFRAMFEENYKNVAEKVLEDVYDNERHRISRDVIEIFKEYKKMKRA